MVSALGMPMTEHHCLSLDMVITSQFHKHSEHYPFGMRLDLNPHSLSLLLMTYGPPSSQVKKRPARMSARRKALQSYVLCELFRECWLSKNTPVGWECMPTTSGSSLMKSPGTSGESGDLPLRSNSKRSYLQGAVGIAAGLPWWQHPRSPVWDSLPDLHLSPWDKISGSPGWSWTYRGAPPHPAYAVQGWKPRLHSL